jgi:hypothetical protein
LHNAVAPAGAPLGLVGAPGAVTPVGSDVEESECDPKKDPNCPSGLVVTVVVAVETLVVVAGGELVEVDEHAASISAVTTAMPSLTI